MADNGTDLEPTPSCSAKARVGARALLPTATQSSPVPGSADRPKALAKDVIESAGSPFHGAVTYTSV
jgi:hypothetical protein